MKLTITDGADPNYLATVIKLPKIQEHPNAERLSIVEVFGNTVIIGKGSYTEGETVVYFPVESCISGKFLSYFNLFDNADVNADGKTKGFFTKSGRVKAISLRSIPSQGFLFKVSELAKYYEIEENTFRVGDSFDTVGGDCLVTKYIKNTRGSGEGNVKKSRVPKWVDKTIGVFPRPMRRKAYLFVNAWFNRDNEGIKSKIVDGEFRFHGKTENLGKNLFLVNPDDFISITDKLHGTSAIFCNIQCKKNFSPLRYVHKFIDNRVSNLEYKFIYSSRSVLKNKRDGKFTEDVWGDCAKKLVGEIPRDYSVYGEIVGHTPGGKTIQKNYDYGVPKNECELRVYKITYNLSDGKYRELEWYEVEEFCDEHGLKTVPVRYTGLAKDLFADTVAVDDDWRDNFLSKLKETYLDKTCGLCTTGVVNEGVVLRIENRDSRTALKFKSPKFVIAESSARDNNEEDMEEES